MTDSSSPAALSIELFSSSFCGACRQTRSVLDTVDRLVPAVRIVEHDVALAPDLADAAGIEATPTVILRDASGTELFRATGVPNAPQVLAAVARGLDAARV